MDRQAYTWINGDRQGERDRERERGADGNLIMLGQSYAKVYTHVPYIRRIFHFFIFF